MSSEWEAVTIGDLVELQRGLDLPTQVRESGSVPVMGSAGVSGYHSKVAMQGPGVVIGRSGVGAMGVVSYIETDYWPLNTTLFVKDFKGNDPRFIYYLFRSINFRQFDTGSAQSSLNRNVVYPYGVRVPRLLDEQQAIASTLAALDLKVELLRETNATLEAIAQALFKSWFVDFDPVRAKMEGRAPEGMDAGIAAMFPTDFVQSALGTVPKGWQVLSLSQQFEVTMGQSPPGDTYNVNGSGLAFYQGRADFGFRFPSARVFCTAPTRHARRNDVLISVRAPVGDVNVSLEQCAIGRGVAAVRSQTPSFCLYSMKALRDRFKEFDSHGTVFGSINKKQFETLPCIAPSYDVISAFESIAGAMDARVLMNELQIRALSSLRDTLLPRLISGRLRLTSADVPAADLRPEGVTA